MASLKHTQSFFNVVSPCRESRPSNQPHQTSRTGGYPVRACTLGADGGEGQVADELLVEPSQQGLHVAVHAGALHQRHGERHPGFCIG